MIIKIVFLVVLCMIGTACCPCGDPVTPVTEPTQPVLFSIEDGTLIKILQAEDGRDGSKLMAVLENLEAGDVKAAVRVAHAAGHIPDLPVWKKVLSDYGQYPPVREALLVAVRCALPSFPAQEILPLLASFPNNDSLCETLLYLDSEAAFKRAAAMTDTLPTMAFNLWRAKDRVSDQMLRGYYHKTPEASVYSIYRMRKKGIVRAEDILSMDWFSRCAGVTVCDDPSRLLEDPIWQVRAAALRVVESPDLARLLLADPNPLVRAAALQKFLQTGGEWRDLTPENWSVMEADMALGVTQSQTLAERIFARGGRFRLVAVPHLGRGKRGWILGSSLPDETKLSFMENRFGQEEAVQFALKRFISAGSAGALQYLLSQESGTDKEKLAALAREKGTFTSILEDFGLADKHAVARPPDFYQSVLKDLRSYRGFKIRTRKGTVTCRFYHAQSPLTCHNMIKLCRENYFNNSRFHRVIPAFVAQDGDPTGTGSGGPGYSIRCEYNDLRYDRAGRVGMALSGKDTGGSQFFVTHLPTPHLNHRYTIFAQVISGLDVVYAIEKHDTITEIILW